MPTRNYRKVGAMSILLEEKMMSIDEHRFAGWNPFDDSHIKKDNVFSPFDCHMFNKEHNYYVCSDCVQKFIKDYREK